MDFIELKMFAAGLQHHLNQLIRAYELCDRVCLVQNGVTTAQGYTLLAFPQEGSINMNMLSETMQLSNSTMTRMVDQLVQKELVCRKADDKDRRVVRVELTERGREVRHTLENALQDLFSQVFSEIPEDKRSMILNVLEQLTQSLTNVLHCDTCCQDHDK